MKQHVTIVGVLQIIFSVLGLLLALFLFLVITGAGFISGEQEAMFITSIVGTFLGLFLTIISLPGLIGGIFLLKYKEWARILTIIVGIVGLINIPFGTALGIYTLWTLLNADTVQLFKEQNGK